MYFFLTKYGTDESDDFGMTLGGSKTQISESRKRRRKRANRRHPSANAEASNAEVALSILPTHVFALWALVFALTQSL